MGNKRICTCKSLVDECPLNAYKHLRNSAYFYSIFVKVKWKSKVNASPSSGMNIEWIPFGKPYIDHECPLAVCFWDAYWSMTEWLDFQEDKYNSMSPLLQFATYLEQLDTELMPAEGDDNRFGKNDIGPLIDALKYADGKEEFRI